MLSAGAVEALAGVSASVVSDFGVDSETGPLELPSLSGDAARPTGLPWLGAVGLEWKGLLVGSGFRVEAVSLAGMVSSTDRGFNGT